MRQNLSQTRQKGQIYIPPTKGYVREMCKSQKINSISPTPKFTLGIIQIKTKARQLCFSA